MLWYCLLDTLYVLHRICRIFFLNGNYKFAKWHSIILAA